MNSLQLLHRLARNLDVPDAANPTADVVALVADAANAGLQELYHGLPARYRRTTLSHTLRAPEAVTVTFAAQYSSAVAAETFAEAAMGCTLRLGGRDNLVTGTASLLDENLESTLTQSGTLYHDAAPIDEVIEAIVSDVRLSRQGQQGITVLSPDERLRMRDECGLRAVGCPRWYDLDPVGANQAGEPILLLRVSPMPSSACIVRFEAELGPKRLTFAHFTTAAEVWVPAQLVETIFLPLCEQHLVASALWKGLSPAQVAGRTQAAQLQLAAIPAEAMPVRRRAGRPHGY